MVLGWHFYKRPYLSVMDAELAAGGSEDICGSFQENLAVVGSGLE